LYTNKNFNSDVVQVQKKPKNLYTSTQVAAKQVAATVNEERMAITTETVVDNAEKPTALKKNFTMEEREEMLYYLKPSRDPAEVANCLKLFNDTAADVGAEIHSSYVFSILWYSLFVCVLDTTEGVRISPNLLLLEN
jgi:hypothetical protein